MAAQPPPEAKLLDKFPDGISALQYLPSDSTKRIASTSWDGAIRIHDTTLSQNPLLVTHNMESGPLLSLATTDDGNTIFTGGLDGSIRSFDIGTSSVRTIGSHADGKAQPTQTGNASSCLSLLKDNVVVSASWNKELCVWDSQSGKVLAKAALPGKAFCMDVDASRNRIVVATAGRKICIYDFRSNALDLVLERDSSLKFQTRCLRLFPDGHGFCLGSIEGRVGVEFLDELKDDRMVTGKKKYAFKCHRDSNNGLVYPVNAIDFHPHHRNTFATGGCDGTVVLWDGANKKKLVGLPAFPTSVAALAFSHDGTELAIASSYTHEEGDREQHPQDELYIRQILDSEATPKNA